MRKSERLEHSRSVPEKNVQGTRARVTWIGLILSVWALFADTQALAQAAYTWEYRYDAMRRVTGTIAPDPDGAGPLASPATRTTYDSFGRAVKVETGVLTEAHGAVPAQWSGFWPLSWMEYTYDALDRKTRQVSKGNNGVIVAFTQFSYDEAGRLKCSAVRMNPSTFGTLADSAACTPGVAGSQGPDRITKLTYDSAEQLTKVQKAVGTPIQQDYATYTYTNNGKQWTVKDANGNLSSMTYDGHDRLSRWTFPSTTAQGVVNANDYEQYGYDNNGNRNSLRKRDGSTLTYQYDGLNRMTRKIVPERAGLSATHTRDVYLGYDLRGLQTYARFDDGVSGEGVTSTFNGFGDLVGTTLTMDNVTRQLSYQRDKDGNRIELTWMDNAKTSYGYDGVDRMKAVYEGALGSSPPSIVNYGYNQRGSLDSQTGRFGQLSNFGYDAAGRMTSISHDLSGTNYDVTYEFKQINPAGQIARRWTSNAAYAFTEATTGSRSYSKNGLNQYTNVGGVAYGYDANGNLTSDGTNTYLYDVENRLVSATKATSSTTLRYDPLGRLYETASTTAGTTTTTRFLHDGDELVAEFNSAGTLLRRYAHGSRVDDPVVWYEGANTNTARWLHTNWQGSVVAVTDNTGASIARNKYDEYGAPATGNMGRFQYTGQALIPEIGLYYYKARIYSPALGRFLQTDPIGYKDDFNLYAYVGNDPANKTDPSGLYGMGTGWDDDSWKKFNKVQQQAAKDMDKRATKLEAKADKLDAKGKSGGDTMRATAGHLRDGAAALRSDGSDGKVANRVDAQTYQAMGGSESGAAFVKGNGPIMTVNGGNAAAWTSGASKSQWVVGHESLHTAGLNDQKGPNGAFAYKFGYPVNIEAFRAISGTDKANINPDSIMNLVYPWLQQ